VIEDSEVSELTDRLRAAVEELRKTEVPVRDFVHQTNDWSQRGLWRTFTMDKETPWDIADGRFRQLFRREPPESLVLWVEECLRKMRVPPLRPEVLAGYRKLPAEQKRALMQHCILEWIDLHDDLPPIPPQPDELRPQRHDAGDGVQDLL
jgi:hypothetical protein